MLIGPYQLDSNIVLAPMAGVTDLPFRQLCRSFGAGLAAGEMLTSDSSLWDSRKSRTRMDHGDETAPRVVQIVGNDPAMMAQAAQLNVDRGAQIIDINMGCPAKKVCSKAAGSALLRDEPLVAAILSAVVAAVTVPVTLKIRTGWDATHRNGPQIAHIAEDCGIQALAVHGRTRACRFEGNAEYDTIRQIKKTVRIPVFANGDIDSPQKAREVLEFTHADGVMIGRAAQGQPWIFRDVQHFLATHQHLPPPSFSELRAIMRAHLRRLYTFYGELPGVRIARKHIGWYAAGRPHEQAFRQLVMKADTATQQLNAVEDYFDVIAAAA